MADALHLLQPVADVEHRAAPRASRSQRDEQLVGLLRRQHRSRLVHDQQFGVLQQAAHDLDALALADREIGDDAQSGRAAGRSRRDLLDRRLASAARDRPCGSASAMFSVTVSASNSEKCWNTMPMPSCARRRGIGDA